MPRRGKARGRGRSAGRGEAVRRPGQPPQQQVQAAAPPAASEQQAAAAVPKPTAQQGPPLQPVTPPHGPMVGIASGRTVCREEERRPGMMAQSLQLPVEEGLRQERGGEQGVGQSGRGGAIPKQGRSFVVQPPVEEMENLELYNRSKPTEAEKGGQSVASGGAIPKERKPRRNEYTDPFTKPEHIVQKLGSSGKPFPVSANCFRLEMSPNWLLYQYHVDFNPPVESRAMRIELINLHSQLLGYNRAFDGMILYLRIRLPQEVTEVFSLRRTDNAQIRITIKLTNELPPNSPLCVQVMNIIFRRLLRSMKMEQIGRQYFDVESRIPIPQHM